jgi:hypothetical protein
MLTSEHEAPPSTKACDCGETRLVLLASIDRKLCPTCRGSIIWRLDEGQESLNGSHRAGRLTLAPKAL